MKKHIPFWLITISVFIVLLVPVLIQDGMFMDGLQYACVSKNLAHHLGTFWFPHLSETWIKSGSSLFLEHPPLVYGIESLFFKVLGDSMYVERFYSFLTAVVSMCLIIALWNLSAGENSELKKISWLAVLFWIMIPVCYWSYQNNMQENTMGTFTLASVFFTLKGIRTGKLLPLFASGAFVFLATLCKGVTGFFPIVVVILYRITYRNISNTKTLLYSAVLVLTPVFLYSLLFLNQDARESMSFYFNERFLARLTEHDTDSRFFILFRLAGQLLLPLSICFAFLLVMLSKAIPLNYNRAERNSVAFFLLTGISGSLPLMLTMVQKGFYFVPALPYFAISFALFVAPGLIEVLKRSNLNKGIFNALLILSAILLTTSIILSALQSGKASRDEDLLEDVYRIGAIVPPKSVIKIDGIMNKDWGMQFYLQRYFNISADASNKWWNDFYLVEKGSSTTALAKYKRIDLYTNHYYLYKLVHRSQ